MQTTNANRCEVTDLWQVMFLYNFCSHGSNIYYCANFHLTTTFWLTEKNAARNLTLDETYCSWIHVNTLTEIDGSLKWHSQIWCCPLTCVHSLKQELHLSVSMIPIIQQHSGPKWQKPSDNGQKSSCNVQFNITDLGRDTEIECVSLATGLVLIFSVYLIKLSFPFYP